MSDTVKIGVPSPDGEPEMHAMYGDIGIPVEGSPDVTTNRCYFSHEGDGLELTAEDARRLAGTLRTAADALENHHDVRMPIEDFNDE